MRRGEILRRLEERLARGEISEKTYLEIKARYEAEPEEPEEPPIPPVPPIPPIPPIPPMEGIGEAVARITADATRAAAEAIESAGEAIRAVDFSGMGVKLSDEAIKIAGSGVVAGKPVRTRQFKAAGSARVDGDLETDEVKVAGSCAFEGSVTTDEFRSSGSSRVAGSLKAAEAESSGSLHVEKDLEASELVTSGSLRVGGQVRAEEFHASGSVRIAGGLKAKEVFIELGGSSSISTIEAEEINVRSTGAFLRSRGDLTSERIEGHEIRLEGTTANLVKGEEVRIGPHCRIGVVEARELVVHESSEVKERRTYPS